jgi:hypothetical protein
MLTISSVLADTIHLKNGSVIKGKVASFGDDQFVVMLETGSGRYLSKALIYIGDVARIEFDSAPAIATEPTASREPAGDPVGIQPSDGVSRASERESNQRKTQPSESQPRDTAVSDPAPPPSTIKEQARETVKDPEPTSTGSSVPPQLQPEVAEASAPPRKFTGPVKTVNVDVAAKRDWTSSGLIVKRGDRIRITATGTVVLDGASGQTSGPEGLELADARKLMNDRPTGALIGVIGADNDDFIFVGRVSEFTATRDGLLFLSVNEGALADNQGTYKATIEVQSQGGRRP